MDLNQEYLLEVFFTRCKRPIYKRYQNIYNAECPVCKEGKSAGRTRRLFYFPQKQYFYCHNCCKSWKPFEWVREITGLSVSEILKQNKEKEQEREFIGSPQEVITKSSPLELPDLPENCIDLEDKTQCSFYKDNHIIRTAKEYCTKRKLFTAVNRCSKLYVCLDDRVHKNRLIIPFFESNGKISSYQSRALSEKQFPRYLTKPGEKGIFNIDNVDSTVPYVFVFEGPIDSMFVKNGVAMASLAPTEKQKNILQSLVGYQLIFVFDNDKNNQQTQKRINKHIKEGAHVFVWPKEFKRYKDFNEVCCKLNIDEIPWKFVVKHSASGIAAQLKRALIAS